MWNVDKGMAYLQVQPIPDAVLNDRAILENNILKYKFILRVLINLIICCSQLGTNVVIHIFL